MRTVPMFASPVVYTRRRTFADQLGRTYCGIRHLFSRDLIAHRDALHPCWTAAHFLPCTRPPDGMRLYRPQRGRIHHGPSERRAFVSTRSGLQTMPTGGHGDDTAPAAATGAAAGNVRRFTPIAPPRDLSAFSPPSSKGCSSGGHFLFLLLLVISRSYSLYSSISGSEDPHNSLVFPDIAVFLRFPFKWVLF